MFMTQVKTVNDALAYITDCNLATVVSLALKKSRPKSEFIRQIDIAQFAVDWMQQMDVDFSGTRAEDIVNKFDGNVKLWIEAYLNGLAKR